MSLQYIKDQKGRNQLLYKGYLHKKVRSSGNKIFWKCANCHKYCCTGRAHTSNGQVVKYLPHLHPPDKTPTEVSGVPYGMKEMTVNPDSICAGATLGCDPLPAVAAKKPRIQSNPSQTIQRLRERLNATRQYPRDLQAPVTVVETTAEDQTVSSSLKSGFHKYTDSCRDRITKSGPLLCEKKHVDSAWTMASQEAARQRFHLATTLPGERLQEILSRLRAAALQWLRPLEHSKEQIVDMVIQEQFLSVLPGDMQTWLRAREPRSSEEVVQLAKTYKEQEPSNPIQDLVTFEDVSVHFTEDEWALLSHRERKLHWNVMHQNYDNVASLAGDQIKEKSQEEDPLQEDVDPSVEWLGKSKEAILQLDLNKNCPENQQKRISLREEMFIPSQKTARGPDRDTILPGTEVGLENECVHINYEECDVSTLPVNIQKSLNNKDLPGSQEITEMANPHNFKQNLIREGQNDAEMQQSDEKSTLLSRRNPIHLETRSSQEAQCIAMDNSEQAEPLVLDDYLKSNDVGNSKLVVLSDKSLERFRERISPSPDPDAVHICSKICPAEFDEIVDLTSEIQNFLEGCQTNKPGSERGQEKVNSSGNDLQEPATQRLHPVTQRSSEAQHSCRNHGNEDDASEISLGKNLATCSIKQSGCSDSAENSLSALIKHRSVAKKYFSRKNLYIKSVLGAHPRNHARKKLQNCFNGCNWGCYRRNRRWLFEPGSHLQRTPKFNPRILSLQTGEVLYLAMEVVRRFSVAGFSDIFKREQQQRSFSLPLLDKMATEPTLSQLMFVLQQVVANTVEIKSAISSLFSTVTAIQNALGSFSGCTDEAERLVSDSEDPTLNTSARLVLSCHDIKATEAKLVEKATQTNVRAGL